MRIIGDFAWDSDYNDDLSWTREQMHFVYQLKAYGDNCPKSLSIFYIGVTNNPVARLIEHMFKPHSGSMQSMILAARVEGWEIEMELIDVFSSREEAEIEEKRQIDFYARLDSGFQLMNMEGMRIPVMIWLEQRVKFTEVNCPHDAHVIEFRKQA